MGDSIQARKSAFSKGENGPVSCNKKIWSRRGARYSIKMEPKSVLTLKKRKMFKKIGFPEGREGIHCGNAFHSLEKVSLP